MTTQKAKKLRKELIKKHGIHTKIYVTFITEWMLYKLADQKDLGPSEYG